MDYNRRAVISRRPSVARAGIKGRWGWLCLFAGLLVCLSRHINAFAGSSESGSYNVEFAAFFYGGDSSASNNFNTQPGVLGSALNAEEDLSSKSYNAVTNALKLYGTLPSPEAENIIKALKAKTSSGGENILEGTWQRDSGPYFYWDVEEEDMKYVAGFSHSLDVQPDEKMDTTHYFFQYPDDSIRDGKHAFYVKAFKVKDWGNSAVFNIWVDTAAPVFNSVLPSPGAVFSRGDVEFGCVISDLTSGLNLARTVMRLNGKQVPSEFNPAENKLMSQALGLSQGEGTVLVEAEDNAGNRATKSWTFIVDTSAPSGSIIINSGDALAQSPYVILNFSASDEISGVSRTYLSNDGVFDAEFSRPYEYSPQVKNWLLDGPGKDGLKTVYVIFEDKAGNRSKAYSSGITLKLPSSETRIVSGPQRITDETGAKFIYQAGREGSLFSYKLDNGQWSQWSVLNAESFSALAQGNHYFLAKSAFDLNANGKIEIEEEDSTPAEWVWTVAKQKSVIDKLRDTLFWKRQ